MDSFHLSNNKIAESIYSNNQSISTVKASKHNFFINPEKKYYYGINNKLRNSTFITM